MKRNNRGHLRTRSITAIENAINIVETAVDKEISIAKAAKILKFSVNYVSELKPRLKYNLEAGNITKTLHTKFMKVLDKYIRKHYYL